MHIDIKLSLIKIAKQEQYKRASWLDRIGLKESFTIMTLPVVVELNRLRKILELEEDKDE